VLVVVHKGVIRAIARRVLGEELAEGIPELAGIIQLTRTASGKWIFGRHSSDPTDTTALRAE
jgi:broad specificity phosphatase PhoE